MGKQINLFVTEREVRKIENYLIHKGLVFVLDQILPDPQAICTNELLKEATWARFITFPTLPLAYHSWKEDGFDKYRLASMGSLAIILSFYGKVGDMYRIRFYYSDSFAKNEVPSKAEFEALVDTFFRWLRKNYQRMPEFPTFYQNPAQPVSVPF
jgi:hypothetical protein